MKSSYFAPLVGCYGVAVYPQSLDNEMCSFAYIPLGTTNIQA